MRSTKWGCAEVMDARMFASKEAPTVIDGRRDVEEWRNPLMDIDPLYVMILLAVMIPLMC